MGTHSPGPHPQEVGAGSNKMPSPAAVCPGTSPTRSRGSPFTAASSTRLEVLGN
jgi:hypothetical protein